ncbi:MAG: aminodeoxychorismate synthase component I [Sphingomonadaceae bacterium]
MTHREPFILLDDARTDREVAGQLYTKPEQIFVAWHPDQVIPVLEKADEARLDTGHTLAGYCAYEAGLVLEPRLMPLAAQRTGANGPLVWLGLFPQAETLDAKGMEQWLDQSAQGPASLGPLTPQISTGAYCKAFTALQEAITAGDIYQANLTFPLTGAWRGDPIALYAALRPAGQAGYGALVYDGSDWLLSLSPELFFRLQNGNAKVKPMKGTRPRSDDAMQDQSFAEDLAQSAKDKAENLMIVDLMRNDLGRVAMAGTVRVDQLFAIESYPTVHQMVSSVRARLQPGRGAQDLLRAIFPCGSITGAPKIRAMELINAIERDARGPYCGAIGRISGNGDAAFNVAIRTLRLRETENQRGKAVLGVGSAIVADSQPLPEWREAIVKGSFARQNAAGFDLIETMRFDPHEGIPLLERHLERMKASAQALGFAFDRHMVRNRIQALSFELETAARLRLLLARSGEVSIEASPVPAIADRPMRVIVLPLPVDEGDFRLRHKTSDRGFYDQAQEVAQHDGADEALFLRDDGLLTEGSFTNIFVARNDRLLTPPASLGLLPGVLRQSLIDEGRAQEAELSLDDLAGGFFLGNALRGLVKAELS